MIMIMIIPIITYIEKVEYDSLEEDYNEYFDVLIHFLYHSHS